ncbi:hypothetical protein LR48_Vigan02g043900 [Vigna angularis]|uniref:Uncharacterized protein n=2 Tax=Phaseolus angularis TaxID=3914 RepID=A0A0L9TVS6_PHAAN|nr:hypothetical protein LR48_Vigan02g043900 [Vigna angularis]BAT96278.1 hypothetical protein VIGAN_08319200 [Vigna angularis var. angularis]
MYEKGVKYEEVRRGKARGGNDESLELYSNTDSEKAFWNHAVTLHERCKVFKGRSIDSSQLLFSSQTTKTKRKVTLE